MNKDELFFQKVISFIVLCLVITYVCVRVDLSTLVDFQYFYNRVLQLKTCLKDGVFPYFYYNDFKSVGYGSSFFYGQIILYPLILFTNLNEGSFYSIVVILFFIINYFGVLFLSKRFTNKNNHMIAILFIVTPYMLSNLLVANLLAVGVSWFFIAKCIDFFRDNKSFIN